MSAAQSSGRIASTVTWQVNEGQIEAALAILARFVPLIPIPARRKGRISTRRGGAHQGVDRLAGASRSTENLRHKPRNLFAPFAPWR